MEFFSILAVILHKIGSAIIVFGQSYLFPSGSGGGGSSVTIAQPYVTIGGNTYGPLWPVTIPPLTGWSTFNGATLDTAAGYPYVTSVAFSAVQIAGITRAAPATPYSIIVTVAPDGSGYNTAAVSDNGWLIGFSDGTKFVTMMAYMAATNNPKTDIIHWTNATTLASNVQQSADDSKIFTIIPSSNFAFKFLDDGTNIKFFYSSDGGNHFPAAAFYSEARTSFLANVNNLAVGVYPNTGAGNISLISWKQGVS